MARPGFVEVESSIQGVLSGPESIMTRVNLSHVLAFEHSVQMPQSSGTTVGVFGGQPVHQPVVFVKPIDETTPQLYQALCERELLNKMVFFWTRFNPKGDVELIYEVELLKARLVSVQPQMPDLSLPNNDALPYREKVSVIYETINWRYGPAAEIEYKTRSEAGQA